MSSARTLAELRECWPACGQAGLESRARAGSWQIRNGTLSDAQHVALSRAIESEIIPRLMLAHSEHERQAVRETVLQPSPEDVKEFSRLLLAHETFAAKSFVNAMLARGMTLDVVFIGLFSASARHLGDLWKEDICDFTDVTIALSRLQSLLRDLSPIENDPVPVPGSRRAFLTVAPGDQHTFGMFVVQQFFRQAGWHVSGGIYDTKDEILNAAASESYDVVGLSVSNDTPADDLAALVKGLRKSAPNPAVRMMVGGRLFLERPELVALIGADVTAQDGRRAVPQVSNLLDIGGVQY